MLLSVTPLWPAMEVLGVFLKSSHSVSLNGRWFKGDDKCPAAGVKVLGALVFLSFDVV